MTEYTIFPTATGQMLVFAIFPDEAKKLVASLSAQDIDGDAEYDWIARMILDIATDAVAAYAAGPADAPVLMPHEIGHIGCDILYAHGVIETLADDRSDEDRAADRAYWTREAAVNWGDGERAAWERRNIEIHLAYLNA